MHKLSHAGNTKGKSAGGGHFSNLNIFLTGTQWKNPSEAAKLCNSIIPLRDTQRGNPSVAGELKFDISLKETQRENPSEREKSL